MTKRYGWLGTTRKAAIRDVVSACFDAWLLDWCLQPEACKTSVEEILLASCSRESHAVWMAEVAGGRMLAALGRNRLDALGGRLALAEAEQSGGMTFELASAAVQDLLVRLATRTGHSHTSPVTWESAWPDSILHPEWGGLGLRISFEGFDLLVGIDRAIVDVICPVPAPSHGALSKRAESLGPAPVTLSAVLDFGLVSARDLAGLRTGEVLLNEHTIGQPIALRAGAQQVFCANLARIDGQFAVVATASHTGEKP